MQSGIVLITGASSGIGQAIAERAAKEGYTVILHGRDQEKLTQIRDRLITFGGTSHVIRADLTDSEQRTLLFEEVSHICDCPDIVINNAGFGWYGYFSQMPLGLAESMTALMIEAVIAIDHYFIHLMQKKNQGQIIHIGSIIGGMPNQGVAMYSAVKSFLDSFCTSLYRELQGSGVLVSIIRPGPVKTAFFDRARQQTNGRSIPGESFAVSAKDVAEVVWKNVNHPRRVRYVPGILSITRFWEPFFGWFVDLLGPLLLKR